jgi:hypothetical protein
VGIEGAAPVRVRETLLLQTKLKENPIVGRSRPTVQMMRTMKQCQRALVCRHL